MGFTMSFYSVLSAWHVWVFLNSFSIERIWQPATHCPLWACYAHTLIKRAAYCHMLRLSSNLHVRGLGTAIVFNDRPSLLSQHKFTPYECVYACSLCAPAPHMISSLLTTELVFIFLLTKGSPSIILARAELNQLQPGWEWVRAFQEGHPTVKDRGVQEFLTQDKMRASLQNGMRHIDRLSWLSCLYT